MPGVPVSGLGVELVSPLCCPQASVAPNTLSVFAFSNPAYMLRLRASALLASSVRLPCQLKMNLMAMSCTCPAAIPLISNLIVSDDTSPDPDDPPWTQAYVPPGLPGARWLGSSEGCSLAW